MYNKLPTDPELLAMSREEMAFAIHYKRLLMDEQYNRLGFMLGTRWNPDAVHSDPGPDVPIEGDVTIPLSVLLNTDLYPKLRKMIPKPLNKRDHIELDAVSGRNVIREAQREILRAKGKLLDRAASLLKD